MLRLEIFGTRNEFEQNEVTMENSVVILLLDYKFLEDKGSYFTLK